MKEDTISFVDSFDLASELAATAMNVIKSYDSNLHGKLQEAFAAIIANQSNTDKDVYCCICFKTGLSTVEDDGGTECQLSDGRWVCSRECYEEALLSLMIKEPEVDLDSEPDNQLNQRNNVTKKTIDFDKPVQMKNGTPVRIVSRNYKDAIYPILGLVPTDDGREDYSTWTTDGINFLDLKGGPMDLENVPERGECWVNIYPDDIPNAHPTRERADRHARHGRIACVRVEYEEGEGL